MIKILTLFICIAGLAFGNFDGDEQHNPLSEFAAKILQNLQKEHIPTDGSDSSNSHIHHLHGSKLASKTNKTIKVTIALKTVHTISAESDGRVVNISSTLGVGHALVFTVGGEDIDEYGLKSVDKEVDKTMAQIKAEYLSDNLVAKANETKITLNRKGTFGISVTGKKSGNVTVSYGSTAAANIEVTKGYTESFSDN